MNVLHILSQIEMTGAEAYALTLSEWLLTHNCAVTVVSDKLHQPTRALYIPRQIHNPSFLNHCRNILFLRQYIRENKIQIVHCHSRAAVRAGFWATFGSRVAMISTIHGRQHASYSKRLFDLYGDRIIGVCKNVLTNLQENFRMNPRKMVSIGNPIQMTDQDFMPALSSQIRIAIVARASGPKGQRTKDLISHTLGPLLAANSNLEIDIIGGLTEKLDPKTKVEVDKLRQRHGHRLHLLGYVSNLNDLFINYRLVIGSGRVPIESLRRGIPSYCLGEYACLGLITPENYESFKESNFGDIGTDLLEENFDYKAITADLISILGGASLPEPTRKKLSDLVQEDFSIANTCQEILKIYQSSYFRKWHPRHIPILMYHKIPEQEVPSKHRIFVTKSNFEKHLHFFKKNNFTTLSFRELEEFRTLQKDPRDFPKKPLILTFDDGYVDNLKNAGPLLKKFNMKATIFLLADIEVLNNYWDASSGDPEHEIMTLEQKKELLTYNFEIGSHGFRHEKITSMTSDQAFRELLDSKIELQEQFKTNINVFAFTYGITAPWAARLASKAGYAFAVNTDTGGLHLEENPYAIFRTPIFPEDREPQLRKKTASWYRRYFFMKRKK